MFFMRNNHGNEARKLPRSVHEYMQYRFNMVPEYLDILKCFQYHGTVNGKMVCCVEIFSPNSAKARQLSIKSREELQRHPEMLIFEGYIDGQGSVYVADRREPLVRMRAT